ncbi:MAG: VOC family protein [Phycisphaerales bacterium]
MSEHTHHALDYLEITVENVEAAKRFYAEAFGWTFNDYGPDYAGIINPRGGELGGLTRGEKPGTGGPLPVIYSDTLEDSMSAVKAAGGEISVPPFDFPGGRRFQFLDPSGNQLGVWSPS